MQDRKARVALAAVLIFVAGAGLGYMVRGEHAAAPSGAASDAPGGGDRGAEVSAASDGGARASDGGDGSGRLAAGAQGGGGGAPGGQGDVAVIGGDEPSPSGSGASGSGATGSGSSGGGVPLPGVTDGGRRIGRLDASAIRGVVRDHRDELGFCFAWQLHQHPELEGRVTMSFTIGEDGRVTEAEVVDDQLGDETVLRCFVNVTRRMEFPAPEDGEVSVRYPFVLSPRDDESQE